MFKPLLLSGWFRVQPFLNSAVIVMLIAPLIAASGHSTSAKQSKVVAKITPKTGESEAVAQETANISNSDLAEIFQDAPSDSTATEPHLITKNLAVVEEQPILQTQTLESLVVSDYAIKGGFVASNDLTKADPLAAVELAPIPEVAIDIKSLSQEDTFAHKRNKSASSLAAIQTPTVPELPQEPDSTTEAPASQAPSQEQAEQTDPIGSPHPIPWKWIVATQEAIGSKGGTGVRYYRSVPVISPDGKYAVYSRVRMEIAPEMYNSRVTSTMFVEDRQTKKLRVMASTSARKDPLLKTRVGDTSEVDKNGKIGVLVPVSWSEKSDRFLARKFEGVFNTGDATDQAVIWDSQKNHTNTIAPARQEDDHEKIAVLLGWSKNQPEHVLFREGEMGEEDWPLVQVATDGKTVNSTDTDQPVTFGDKLTEVWSGPQVATR